MSEETSCSKCHRKPHPGCEGHGIIPVDALTVKRCPHYYALLLARHLGEEISSVKHARETPLLQPAPNGGKPLVDLTKQNIYIECRWRGLLPHLKTALAFQGPEFPFRIVTDEKIKNVFVGNESYKNRQRDERDDIEVHNGLPDLIGENSELVIIRLGHLGYKNISAAGALKEALMHRAMLRKATWLIVDPDQPWIHSKSDDVEFYVSRNFKEVRVFPADPGTKILQQVVSTGMSVNDEDDELPDLIPSRSRVEVPSVEIRMPGTSLPKRRVEIEEPSGDDFSIDMPGGDAAPRKKRWGR